MNPLRRIRIVLVRPTHPGNVGGAARALKTMGLDALCVVTPAPFPHPDASARAAGAEDVLDRTLLAPDLDGVLEGCHFVVGASARSRHIDWPALDVPAAAARLVSEAERGTVALLFGQERAGLTNAELDRCHALVQIPANPEYASLNLVSAVQILAYELRRAAVLPLTKPPLRDLDELPASAADMEHFYQHLESVLVAIGFLDPANPRLLMRRLRRLFNRAEPDRNEMNILRGILSAVQRASSRKT